MNLDPIIEGLLQDVIVLKRQVANLSKPEVGYPNMACGRLTLTTDVPVITGTVSAATTIYWTPYKGNKIGLYTGSFWKDYLFSQISVTVPSTVYRLFDIFIYDNSGTLTLEAVNWNQSTAAITGATNATPIVITSNGHGLSNNDMVAIASVGGNTAANGIWSVASVAANTFQLEGSTGSGAYTSGGTWYKLNATRATALTLQNGIYVKTGETGKRYLGTGMTTGTSGQTEIAGANHLLWNYYNRVFKGLGVTDNTTHTYTSATARIYRNVNANKIAYVVGVVEDVAPTELLTLYNFDSGDGTVSVGAAQNRTGVVSGLITNVQDVFNARFLIDIGAFTPDTGYNFFQLTQSGAATSPDFQTAILRAQIYH